MKTKDILIRNVPLSTMKKFRKQAKDKRLYQAEHLTRLVELSTGTL